MTQGLIVAGFHRSGTSLAAQILHDGGLALGPRLVGPDPSNPRGHFEDAEVVALHDRMLARHGSSWQFHDEVVLAPNDRERDAMRSIARRRAEPGRPWGFKDPRASLFLGDWFDVAACRGVLIVFRHWSAVLRSLQRRAAHQLCVRQPERAGPELALFRDPERPVEMWLSTNRRLAAFATARPECCLVVPHDALLAGYPLLDRLRARFDVSLRASAVPAADAALVHHHVEDPVPDWLPAGRVAELDACWRDLVSLADQPASGPSGRRAPLEKTATLLDRVDTRLAGRGAVCADPLEAQLDPTTASVEACRGEAERWLEAGELRRALPWAERAASGRDQPADVSLLFRIRLQLGDFDEARRTAQRAIGLAPDQPTPYLQLANAEAGAGDLDAALRALDEALARSTADDVAIRVRRGWLLRLRGDLEGAIAEFEEVRARHPAHAGALHGLVDAWREQGDLARALELSDRLRARHPELVGAEIARATVLMQQGRTREGLETWRAAERRGFDAQRFRNRLERDYLPAMASETAGANFLAAIVGCLDELVPDEA